MAETSSMVSVSNVGCCNVIMLQMIAMIASSGGMRDSSSFGDIRSLGFVLGRVCSMIEFGRRLCVYVSVGPMYLPWASIVEAMRDAIRTHPLQPDLAPSR